MKQFTIASDDIKSNAVLKFAKTYRAQELRSGIAFFQMIGSVHDTLIKYAVRESKHVAGFMDQDFAASVQQKLLVTFCSFFPIKCWVVTGKTKHADPFSQGCLPKNEIPRRMGIKVFIHWASGFVVNPEALSHPHFKQAKD